MEVLLEVEGRRVKGAFEAAKERWTLRWPGGEATFTPTAQLLGGDEALDRFLAEVLRPRGVLPHVCGTCAYFAFSGASWSMSGGWVGYCIRAKGSLLDPLKDTTGIWDGCEHWKEVRR